jgi:hypothetical protein
MISLLIILQILLEEVEEAEVEEEVEESVAKEMRLVVVEETEMAEVHLRAMVDDHHPAMEEEGVVRDEVVDHMALPEAMDDLVDKGMEEEMEVGVVVGEMDEVVDHMALPEAMDDLVDKGMEEEMEVGVVVGEMDVGEVTLEVVNDHLKEDGEEVDFKEEVVDFKEEDMVDVMV